MSHTQKAARALIEAWNRKHPCGALSRVIRYWGATEHYPVLSILFRCSPISYTASYYMRRADEAGLSDWTCYRLKKAGR
jgi:hypothetical protein